MVLRHCQVICLNHCKKLAQIFTSNLLYSGVLIGHNYTPVIRWDKKRTAKNIILLKHIYYFINITTYITRHGKINQKHLYNNN